MCKQIFVTTIVDKAGGNGKLDADAIALLEAMPVDAGDDRSISNWIRLLRERRAAEALRVRDDSRHSGVSVSLAPPRHVVARRRQERGVAACSTMENEECSGALLSQSRGASENGESSAGKATWLGTMLAVVDAREDDLGNVVETNVARMVHQHTPVAGLKRARVTVAVLSQQGITAAIMLDAGYRGDEMGVHGIGMEWRDLVALGITPELLSQHRRVCEGTPGALSASCLVGDFLARAADIYRDLCTESLDSFLAIGYSAVELRLLQCNMGDLIAYGLRRDQFMAMRFSFTAWRQYLNMTPEKLRVMQLEDRDYTDMGWDMADVTAFLAPSVAQKHAAHASSVKF